MREILFRGKRVNNGKWVEGFYCKHDTVMVCFTTDDPKTKHLIITDGFCDWGFEPPLRAVEVDPATVGQCSGLTDKNGKPIFEADVVRFTERQLGGKDVPVVEAVEFSEGGFATHRYFLNNWLRNAIKGNCQLEDIEVIGNIHDNPELLEGGGAREE